MGDPERKCMDCLVVIVPDARFPHRRRCYTCAIYVLETLLTCQCFAQDLALIGPLERIECDNKDGQFFQRGRAD